LIDETLVSVVIVTYNEERALARLLRTLTTQDYRNYEVIIVDNASNSSVRNLAEAHGARYLDSTRNLGYTGGNNLGVSRATGRFILILNADTWLAPKSLERMVQAFSEHGARCVVVVPKIMIRDSDKINSIGMRRFHKRANLYANIGYLETDHGQYDSPSRVEAFDGAAFMFRRALLHETFLFNPFYFWGEESTDLAERIRLLRYEIWTCPESVVRHEIHATFHGDPSALRARPVLIANNLAHTLTNMGVTSTLLTALTLVHFSLVRIRQRQLIDAKQCARGIFRFVLSLGRILKSTSDLRSSVQ